MCAFKKIVEFFTLLSIFLSSLLSTSLSFGDDVPVFYKGRFRPMEAYARLWLSDVYNKQSIKKEDRASFNSPDGSATELLWRLNFSPIEKFQNSPFFWIHYAEVKQKLGLNLKKDRFSYNQLIAAINPLFLEGLVAYYYQQSGKLGKVEISQLSPDLWVSKYQVIKVPATGLFSQLKAGHELQKTFPNKLELEESLSLLSRIQQFKQLHDGLILKMLPSKKKEGEWLPINTLGLNQLNPTIYNDDLYHRLQEAYQHQNIPLLSQLLLEGYKQIAGTVYQEANGKALTYPSIGQLRAETLYYQYPLIEITILLYGIGILLYLLGFPKCSLISISLAFFMHTLILGLRCYILGRPPVSNMFETIIYVPWMAVFIGFIFRWIFRSDFIVAVASTAAMTLLLILKVTDIGSSMENVQAVLDSQYWLIIHVLMVVGSYGLFVLAGILGQIYLAMTLRRGIETESMNKIAQTTLQAMYIGVALLIPGTILGGVWAAESWGRFWDWDPKESWAFISSCVYLMFIHAYTFRHIGHFGLAMGAVIGLLTISFTWYGVNYILGTGLHSYGFGSGGEWLYYSFVTIEILFLGFAALRHQRKKINISP